jgi:DNA-binding transcriptional LysR family regulator
MLDLNDIVVFASVVEAGSFTAAARVLAMPKTTVSRRVAALEREVGVRLLQRTTRSLSLTDAGVSTMNRAARPYERSRRQICISRRLGWNRGARSAFRRQSASAAISSPMPLSTF